MITLKETREIQTKNMGNSLIKHIDQAITRQATYGRENPWFEASMPINISNHMAKYVCDAYIKLGDWEKMVVTIKKNVDSNDARDVESKFYLCDPDTVQYLNNYIKGLGKNETVVYMSQAEEKDSKAESVNNVVLAK